MKRRQRITIIHRVISLLLAAYLLNFSVDTRDAHPDTVAEDLSINDIESVYEFVAEGLIGVENAVQEHDERDQDDSGSFEFKKFFFVSTIEITEMNPAVEVVTLSQSAIREKDIINRAIAVVSPPPKV